MSGEPRLLVDTLEVWICSVWNLADIGEGQGHAHACMNDRTWGDEWGMSGKSCAA
jgi:hypothetical protein